MKIALQIIIGLIILGFIIGFVIKNRYSKTSIDTTENKVLVADNKPILKQFGDLTPEDFIEYPIWIQCHIIDYNEQWYEDTDEETFRPWIDKTPVSPEHAMFLVKADMNLNDGELLNGFITPCLSVDYKNENDLGLIQPQIFTHSGERVGFWTGMFPMEKTGVNDFYKMMGKDSDKIFPISFKVDDELSTGITSGRVNGFLSIGKDDNIIITK